VAHLFITMLQKERDFSQFIWRMAKNTPTASFSNCPNSLKPLLYPVHTSAAFLRLAFSCRPHQSIPKKGFLKWKHRLSVPFSYGQKKGWTDPKYRSKMIGYCRVFKLDFSSVAWTEYIWCVFRVKRRRFQIPPTWYGQALISFNNRLWHEPRRGLQVALRHS